MLVFSGKATLPNPDAKMEHETMERGRSEDALSHFQDAQVVRVMLRNSGAGNSFEGIVRGINDDEKR